MGWMLTRRRRLPHFKSFSTRREDTTYWLMAGLHFD
ncbi:unnamed protein product [Brassica oleracea var. botrytis]|uniref:(rape) hypothetical protein n=1 Tax=Brassica napus TaxID=3708 RepID=A0A816HZL6_BRANA|nr:unnamed protein product [Brassica napus]